MNETQPIPPEPCSPAADTEPQIENGQVIDKIFATLAARQADNQKIQADHRRILDLLEEPLRLAEQQKQQSKDTADAWRKALRNYAQGGDPE